MTKPDSLQRIRQATHFLREQIAMTGKPLPRIAVVLGSGLGEFADSLETSCVVDYTEIPHFPRPTVTGHAGRLLVGTIRGVPVIVLQGRVHAYEGYSPEEVVFPIRVLGGLGITQLILTNAAGSLSHQLAQGSLVAISDHINLTGTNPCTGVHDPQLGPQFFDMTHAYSRRLRQLALRTAFEQGWTMQEGIYLGVSGPSFETPAEIRFFRTIGADLVGMSTVQEVIAARHIGLEVLAISCVTNLAAGLTEAELNHAEVLETGQQTAHRLGPLLTSLVPSIATL
ncbi:MAG TPA: purine-nucleoside phosphorylase [Acidobacteriaceae bacterium]|nr:purine-nucleoside phosphorylase [Acidobacteriaceae bacterium]